MGFAFSLLIVTAMQACASPTAESYKISVAEPFQYVRIYADQDGESHFQDETMRFELIDFAPPAPPISVSDIFDVEGGAVVISSPPDWFGDWHQAPARQLVIGLAGCCLSVEVSDGEVREFGPGEIIMVEDTFGKGHVSRLVGEERMYMLVVPLAPSGTTAPSR